MFELMIAIAFLGVLISGIWDLFTTEIPDEIPTLMAFIGVFGWLLYAQTDIMPLIASISMGSLFLIAGWAAYKHGQWGGGDAKLLAAVVYVVPFWRFAADFTLNLLISGSVYIVIYALIAGMRNRKTLRYFADDLKENKKTISLAAAIIIAIGSAVTYISLVSSLPVYNGLWLVLISLGLVLFWRYGVVIETKVFMKKIPSSELKPGDVIADSKQWDGLKKWELESIRKNHEYVTIKDGVRFGPAFPAAFLITLYYGNLMLLVI